MAFKLAERFVDLPAAAERQAGLSADAQQAAAGFKLPVTGARQRAQVLRELIAPAVEAAFERPKLVRAATGALKFGASGGEGLAALGQPRLSPAGAGARLNELKLLGKAHVQGRRFAAELERLAKQGMPVLPTLARPLEDVRSQISRLAAGRTMGRSQFERLLATRAGAPGAARGKTAQRSGFAEAADRIGASLPAAAHSLLADLVGPLGEPAAAGFGRRLGISADSRAEVVAATGVGPAREEAFAHRLSAGRGPSITRSAGGGSGLGRLITASPTGKLRRLPEVMGLLDHGRSARRTEPFRAEAKRLGGRRPAIQSEFEALPVELGHEATAALGFSRDFGRRLVAGVVQLLPRLQAMLENLPLRVRRGGLSSVGDGPLKAGLAWGTPAIGPGARQLAVRPPEEIGGLVDFHRHLPMAVPNQEEAKQTRFLEQQLQTQRRIEEHLRASSVRGGPAVATFVHGGTA